MNKEELIEKLQMVYVGDINALNELIGYYDGLKEIIKIVQQENKELKEKLALHTGALKREHEVIHRVNDLEERIDKAIEYMKYFIFEPLLTNEDRKLIMYNDNLRNFEKILKEME